MRATVSLRSVSLYVEYAEQRVKYGILFIFSPIYEYSHVEYEHVPIYYRVHQAEYGIHIIIAVSQEYVKQSTGHTHTGHTDRENTPDNGKPHTNTEYIFNM